MLIKILEKHFSNLPATLIFNSFKGSEDELLNLLNLEKRAGGSISLYVVISNLVLNEQKNLLSLIPQNAMVS